MSSINQDLIDKASTVVDLAGAQNQSDGLLPLTNEDIIKYQSTFNIDFITEFDQSDRLSQIKVVIDDVEGDFEDIDESTIYFAPKFSWTNLTIVDPQLFSFWVTSTDSHAYNVSVRGGTSYVIVHDVNLGESCDELVTSSDCLYASGTSNIHVLSHDRFLHNDSIVTSVGSPTTTTASNGFVSLIDGSFIWTVDTSNGIVNKLNSNYTVNTAYSDMDSPFKVRKATYKDTYFIAGSHVVWNIDGTSTEINPIYSTGDKTIVDFDVSENGHLCILIKDDDESSVVILDLDFFTVVFSTSIPFDVKFCKYVGDNQFYVLSQDDSVSDKLSTNHYLFNVDEDTYSESSFLYDLGNFTIVGIDYDSIAKKVVWVLENGFYSTITIPYLLVSEFVDCGISDIASVAASNEKEFNFSQQSKARVFVGSLLGRNDLWDSGSIDTQLTSMYYGGGNNLVEGGSYYVGVQVYSSYGWGDVIQKQFLVPYYGEAFSSSSSSSLSLSSSSSSGESSNILTINNVEFRSVVPKTVVLVSGSNVDGLPTKPTSLPPGFTQLL